MGEITKLGGIEWREIEEVLAKAICGIPQDVGDILKKTAIARCEHCLMRIAVLSATQQRAIADLIEAQERPDSPLEIHLRHRF